MNLGKLSDPPDTIPAVPATALPTIRLLRASNRNYAARTSSYKYHSVLQKSPRCTYADKALGADEDIQKMILSHDEVTL